MGEKSILCDTKSSNGNMDSLHCWNGAKGDQISPRVRPMAADTLSKLAQLITCMEYKPKPQQSSSICKDCGHKFSDPSSLLRHQEREHVLQKLHCCQRCGHKFALLSSLQLHKCSQASSMCQTVPESSEDPFYHDNSPYACAPCGQAFSHKQELLHHQQAGGCQPAKTLKPPSFLYASLPQSPPSSRTSLTKCTLCPKTFRSSAGLACHMRFSYAHMKSSVEKKRVVIVSTMKKKKVLISGMPFQCRSCDKSFSKTSLLHQHRKEEHRREVKVRKLQRTSLKTTRQRRKGETYPCLHCGKEFLHHLTRWAHFKHCSSHHQTQFKLSGKSSSAGAARFHPKAAKELIPSQENRPKRGRPRTKNLPVLMKTKQEEADKMDDSDEDEDAEYPCTSCDQVFSSKAKLHIHEKVHEEVPAERHRPADTCRCCSVCSGGIPLAGIPLAEVPEDCEKKVYHCVPCAEAFLALDAFLEHCQKHLIRENEDEFSDD